MRDWDARHLAAAAGATLVRAPSGALAPAVLERPGPLRASVDTRTLAPGELFVGLRGEHVDGGAHAARALEAGAWGVLVAPEHAQAAVAATQAAGSAGGDGAVLAHADPLAALHALARAWRRELRARGAMVVAITGSTGKTSTKDILAALLAGRLRVASSRENLNTEIGLPLAVLGAPADTELLVLEMAMRLPGADRAADGDRGAGRGRDRERGARAPGAAGDAGGDRGGEGGADRGPRTGGERGGAGARAAAGAAPARSTDRTSCSGTGIRDSSERSSPRRRRSHFGSALARPDTRKEPMDQDVAWPGGPRRSLHRSISNAGVRSSNFIFGLAIKAQRGLQRRLQTNIVRGLCRQK